MAVSRSKTWVVEILTASDLNNEFNNILNNGQDLAWPATKAKDLDGFELILDADGDTSITADTDDQIDFKIGGTDAIVFDSSGRVIIGDTMTRTINALDLALQVTGTTASDTATAVQRFSADANSPQFYFGKSRGASIGAYDVVEDNDPIGSLRGFAADGTDMDTEPCRIQFEVDDAAPTGSSIGGAIVLSTAAGVSGNDITERMRIAANGALSVATVIDIAASTGTDVAVASAVDNEDDIALMRTFERDRSKGMGIIMSKWDEEINMKKNREALRRVGVLTGGNFYCVQRMNSLIGGVVWQLHSRLRETEERLALTESKLAMLPA